MDAFRNAPGCFIALTLCGIPGLGGAGQPAPAIVTYGDLDLNTHQGVTAMYARLQAAAKGVCTNREWPRDRIRCIDYSVGQAVARVGAPRLVILYETRSGHAEPHTAR